jgi:TldD protein
MQHDGVKVTAPSCARSESRSCSSPSDGAAIEQEIVECGAGIDAMAAGDGITQIRSSPERARRLERAGRLGSTSTALGLEREAPRVGEQAAALLRADPCPAGVTTSVVDSEQMELQVHESVGHPTELDRVYGTEAAYAGTSFLKPTISARCATAPST